MTPRVFSPRNGLNKLVEINAGQGNRGLQSQQASTRVIYDSLPQVANTYYRFFDNVNARTFPFTNLSENKLQVNESMVIKWVNFSVFVNAAGLTTSTAKWSSIGTGSLFRSDYWIEVANSMVIKPTPLNTAAPQSNRHAQHVDHESVMMETDVIIPSLLEFILTLRTSYTTVVANTYYMCMLDGQATIYKPNARF